jgi:hypothetical protein
MTAPAVSPQIRWAAVGTVVTVAAVAAVMSYGHLRTVADAQGEDAALLFPLSVDGLIVAASLVLLVRRRSGQPGGPLAWSGLLVGVAATVAGNIASAEPTALARLVAAWPPVAFALSYELLLTLLRPAADTDPEHGRENPAHAIEPAPTRWAAPEPALDPAPVQRETPAEPAPVRVGPLVQPPAPPAPAPAPREAPPAPGDAPGEADDLTARAAELLARADGRPPGRRALARELGCTEYQARAALDALAATNGEVHR